MTSLFIPKPIFEDLDGKALKEIRKERSRVQNALKDLPATSLYSEYIALKKELTIIDRFWESVQLEEHAQIIARYIHENADCAFDEAEALARSGVYVYMINSYSSTENIDNAAKNIVYHLNDVSNDFVTVADHKKSLETAHAEAKNKLQETIDNIRGIEYMLRHPEKLTYTGGLSLEKKLERLGAYPDPGSSPGSEISRRRYTMDKAATERDLFNAMTSHLKDGDLIYAGALAFTRHNNRALTLLNDITEVEVPAITMYMRNIVIVSQKQEN